MKLNKDQKQKIILGVMLMAGITYVTDDFLLTPLATERVALAKEMTTNEPIVRKMRGEIAKANALGLKSPEAKKTMTQIDAMIPDGSPIAWCPPKIVDSFKGHGIERVTARMSNESPEKDLTGYRRLVWNIDIPQVHFATLAQALADFENSEPLFEFTGFDIQVQGERPDLQRSTLTVQNILKL